MPLIELLPERGVGAVHVQAQAAVLVLEEAAVLARHVAETSPAVAETLTRQAEQKQKQASVLRSVVAELKPFCID